MTYPIFNQMSNSKLTPARLWRLHLIGLVLLLVALSLPAPVARAATITVTTTDDEVKSNGECSLREAIIAVNTDAAVDACPAGNGADTIILKAGEYGLTLAGTNEDAAQTGDLDLTADVTIVGAGQAKTTINANDLDRVFDIATGIKVEVSDVTLTGGTTDFGGSIYGHSNSALTLSNSRVDGNTAQIEGGGIYIYSGTLMLMNSQVIDNSAAASGGGIFSASSTVTLANSQVDGNQTEYGGGLYVAGSSQVTLTNSRVTGNTTTDEFGGGGGLYVEVSSTVTVINSQISGNANTGSTDGGGIFGAGTVTLVNSAVSGNSTGRDGGGLYVYDGGTFDLRNVTIANNTADADGDDDGNGGGIYTRPFETGASLITRNSLIGDNVDNSPTGDQYSDCSGALTGAGYNLLENTTGCTLRGSGAGSFTGLDPALGPLQNNGGATLTQALLAGSPAIDAGNPGGCLDQNDLPLATDQRGFARPVNGGSGSARCDMGAFEYDSPGAPTPTATPPPTPTATPDPGPPADYAVYLPLVQK